MNHIKKLLVILLIATGLQAADKPNIIFILADDMGYGDMSFRGGKAATPNCDRLAKEGMSFTDAHTSSSVCTPTRYGILTGRYNWRSTLKKSVLWGYSPPLIKYDRNTVGDYLQKQGYHTGIVGKWHLGLEWERKKDIEQDISAKGKKQKDGWNIAYDRPVKGPTSQGFDYSFIIPASLDMPPYVYIEGETVTQVPTVEKSYIRKGPAGKDFEAVNCLKDFAAKSRDYIKRQAKSDSPFFLYIPLTSPHTPIVPSEEWQGKSSIGKYGDFLMETDWVIGEVLAELAAQGVDENTILIFTTDNGCSPAAKIPDLVSKGHLPNAHWRGHKADIFEGGHRVPFLVRWPSKVKPGTESASTICTTDLFATVAELCGESVDEKTAEDSYSFLPDLLGKGASARPSVVHHSIGGYFAIREGDWKLNVCPGSGGWSSPKPNSKAAKELPIVQLYNLKDDPSEKNNLQDKHPEKVAALVKQLATLIRNGRSTDGPVQKNDGPANFQYFNELTRAAHPELQF